MAGDNDRIHGYNRDIYGDHSPEATRAFGWNHNRPTAFINRPVIVTNAANVMDHQGHIVPQNLLNNVLDPLMADMAANCNDEDEVEEYINAHADEYPWLSRVHEYGTGINAPLFDFDENDPEDKLGNFFSIVTWNPVNICRAPEDNRRGGVPGNDIDDQVVDYIIAHENDLHIIENWLEALEAVRANQDNNHVNAYIAACSNTLALQRVNQAGFYRFPWEQVAVMGQNILRPEQ